MKIVSAIIMIIGLLLGFGTMTMSTSAPQQLTSLIPIIGAYVLGRALENFNDKNDTIIKLLNQIKGKSNSKNDNIKNNTSLKTEKKEMEFIKKAEELKANLKGDEMIVVIKKNQELKIILKSQYESDKELHLTNSYIVVDKNLIKTNQRKVS